MNALAPKHFFEFFGSIRIEFVQNVRTALNNRHFNPEADKELRKLDSHRAAAQNNHRFRQTLDFKRGVAIQAIEFIELRERRWRNSRTGGNDKGFGSQRGRD